MDEAIPHLSSHLLSDTQTKGCTVHTAQLREIYAWAPAHSFSSRTCSYKTDDEPLLNLKGAMSRCSREGDYVLCTQKRELESPLYSKYRGFSVYSMNKTGGRRKMCKWANAASWLGSCWAPSQSLLKPFFRVKWLYDYGFWVWMEAGRWVEFRPKMFPCNCTLQSSNSERVKAYLL